MRKLSIDAHYDSAVARNIMSPQAAEMAKIEGRRNLAVKFYRKQADSLSADDIADFTASMEADFADGGISGLDGEGWQLLQADLNRLAASKRQATAKPIAPMKNAGAILLGALPMAMMSARMNWRNFKLMLEPRPKAIHSGKQCYGTANTRQDDPRSAIAAR
ncbi:MAG: hypothetical protein U5K75_00145 [Ahrensia sp.]|nr:hypothetical protein [Ahrensia sp.]